MSVSVWPMTSVVESKCPSEKKAAEVMSRTKEDMRCICNAHVVDYCWIIYAVAAHACHKRSIQRCALAPRRSRERALYNMGKQSQFDKRPRGGRKRDCNWPVAR